MESKDNELSLDRELHERLVALGFAFAKSKAEILLIEKAAIELKEIQTEDFGDLTSIVNNKPRFKSKDRQIAPPSSQENLAVVVRKGSGSDYFKRTVLAAEILSHLHKEPTMGRIKLQKLIFLCQHTSKMKLHTNFLKQAMGPYDPRMMRSLESQMKKSKWFLYCPNESMKYQPMENAGQHTTWFHRYFSEDESNISYLIDLFRKEKTNQVELVATIYAVWNTWEIKNEILSVTVLISEVYEWSEQKTKFSQVQIVECARWMVSIGLHPKQSRIIGL